MPSIEISLSNDSHCPGCPPQRQRSGNRSMTMTLHQDHLLSEADGHDLAEHVAKNFASNNDTNNQSHYHEIIEIHDDMEDNDMLIDEDDDSGILAGRRLPPLRNDGRPVHDGFVGRFRHMLQDNFASRASMSPHAETRRRTPHEVHFAEHRV